MRETSDISEYVEFDFYDLVWYHTGKHASVIKYHQALGQWMEVALRIGSDVYHFIMPIYSQLISETTVQHATHDDMLDPDIAAHIK